VADGGLNPLGVIGSKIKSPWNLLFQDLERKERDPLAAEVEQELSTFFSEEACSMVSSSVFVDGVAERDEWWESDDDDSDDDGGGESPYLMATVDPDFFGRSSAKSKSNIALWRQENEQVIRLQVFAMLGVNPPEGGFSTLPDALERVARAKHRVARTEESQKKVHTYWGGGAESHTYLTRSLSLSLSNPLRCHSYIHWV
jgi:hypothetical protein